LLSNKCSCKSETKRRRRIKSKHTELHVHTASWGFFRHSPSPSSTTGCPDAKKSITAAKISGLSTSHSTSGSFDTVMKSAPRNTPLTCAREAGACVCVSAYPVCVPVRVRWREYGFVWVWV
jgi:hypothetical protein